MSSFEDLRIVDNFYQTSSFIPMPTILIGTLTETGETTLGAYSLCFPYYVAGKDYYSMVLMCRNSSNTAQNILKTGKCSLNFVTDGKKDFQEVVKLGFPGDHSDEKMATSKFELEKGQAEGTRPLVVTSSYQTFECTWDSSLEDAQGDSERVGQLDGLEPPYRNFNGITSKFGAHFILKIDKILMKERYKNAIIDGVSAKDFPPVPVDYGYRDNVNFWYSPTKKLVAAKVPARKEADVSSVIHAAERIDDVIKFTEESCARLTKVPRVFLNAALKSCVDWAKENGVTLIEPAHMEIIQDKRSTEKKTKKKGLFSK